MAKVQEVNKGNFLTILPEEWEIITETAECTYLAMQSASRRRRTN